MSFRDRIFASKLSALAYNWLTNQEIWAFHASGLIELIDKPSKNTSILDLGCGPGTTTAAMSKRCRGMGFVAGLDISRSMLKYAEKSVADHSLCFIQGDGCALPFKDECFDLVTGHSFLYLVADKDRALAEVSRVLRPGGRLVFLEPNALFRPVSALTAAAENSRRLFENPNATLRFLASMTGWRLASRVAGRVSPATVHALFERHNLRPGGFEERFGTLGLLCTAEKIPSSQK